MSLEDLQDESADYEFKKVMFENVRDCRPFQEVEIEFEEGGKQRTEKKTVKDLLELKAVIMKNDKLKVLRWDILAEA